MLDVITLQNCFLFEKEKLLYFFNASVGIEPLFSVSIYSPPRKRDLNILSISPLCLLRHKEGLTTFFVLLNLAAKTQMRWSLLGMRPGGV